MYPTGARGGDTLWEGTGGNSRSCPFPSPPSLDVGGLFGSYRRYWVPPAKGSQAHSQRCSLPVVTGPEAESPGGPDLKSLSSSFEQLGEGGSGSGLRSSPQQGAPGRPGDRASSPPPLGSKAVEWRGLVLSTRLRTQLTGTIGAAGRLFILRLVQGTRSGCQGGSRVARTGKSDAPRVLAASILKKPTASAGCSLPSLWGGAGQGTQKSPAPLEVWWLVVATQDGGPVLAVLGWPPGCFLVAS